MVDPEAIFSTLFGGERFQDIIGTISLGSEMKSAMQEEHEDDDDDDNDNEGAAAAASVVNANANGQAAAAAAGGSSSSSTTPTATTTKSTKPTLTPEQAAIKEEKQRRKDEHERKVQTEKARVREQRVRQLAVKLRDKLALFSEQAVGEDDKQIADGGQFLLFLFQSRPPPARNSLLARLLKTTTKKVRTMWSIEAEELKKESYGVELLHTVGFVYESKSKSVSYFLSLSLYSRRSSFSWSPFAENPNYFHFFISWSASQSLSDISLTRDFFYFLSPPTFADTFSHRRVRSRSASEGGSTRRGRRLTFSTKPSRRSGRPTPSRTCSTRSRKPKRAEFRPTRRKSWKTRRHKW